MKATNTRTTAMKLAHTIAKTLDNTIRYAKRLGKSISMAWSQLKEISQFFGIYSACYDELKGKDSVSFEVLECEKVGDYFLPLKNGVKKNFNILITDEDNLNLCKQEIESFLAAQNIECHNISRLKIK